MIKKIKKQGAGTSIEHYIQDAAEIRLTALLQEEAERRGVASKNISSEINENFVKTCVANQIQTKFFQSKYSKNIDATYQQHYMGSQNRDVVDDWEDCGIAKEAFQSNIIKYAKRFGKKDGDNPKDIMKIIHYCIFLLNELERKE